MLTRSSIETSLYHAILGDDAVAEHLCQECMDHILRGNCNKCYAEFDPELPQCHYHGVISDIEDIIERTSDKIYRLLP